MYADLKNVPTFGGNSVSAWSYTEKDPFDSSRTSNPPAPNESDVKALLRMLSCNVDDETDMAKNTSATCDDFKGDNNNNTKRSLATPTAEQSLANSSSDFLQFFRQRDADAVATRQLLRPENALAAGSYGGAMSGACPPPASSSSNALTGSSSASSNNERTASTAASRSADSASRQSGSHASRHHTAVSNALANIGSGLAEGNFNVLTPDKRMMLSIPAEYIQTTLGSRNYRHRNRDKLLFSFCLCKTFCSGATCHHGADCDFIHCDPEKLLLVRSAAESKGKKPDPAAVHSFQVHWSTPVNTLADAIYPCLPSGYVVYVKSGDGNSSGSGNAPLALPSELVYATVGGQEALRLPSSAPLRVCKHYEREKCARGALCHFIHPVALAKPIASGGGAATAAAAAPSSLLISQQQLGRGGKLMAQSAPTLPGSSSAFSSLADVSAVPPSFPPGPQHRATAAASSSSAAYSSLPSAPNTAAMLTAAQLPAGALVRYGDALYMWVPEQQQLVALHTTPASGSTSAGPPPSPSAAMAGQSAAMRVSVDYARGPGGSVTGSAPAGYAMPPNAMLVQSSSAFVTYPPQNPYGCPHMPRDHASSHPNQNAATSAGPMFPSMLFPC